MKIIDTKLNKVGLGSDSTKETIGIVFKTSEELENRPLLGLIIPKFMLGYEFKDGDKAEDKTIENKTSKCINDKKCSDFWDKNIIVKNYILVRPLLNQNQSMPNYTIGDKVTVTMIDNDIKTLAFLPYGINRLGQRATDKFVVSVPANKKENTALTEDNTYFFKLDSKEKVAMIHTSKENGESHAYTIGIDTDNSQVIITDNDKMSWVLDSKNDKITTETSGSIIEQSGDKITFTADSMEMNIDSKIYMKTDTLEVETNTIKEKSSETTYEFDSFKQTSNTGKFEIDQEEHKGMKMTISESTYYNDTNKIGLNGQVIMPQFVINEIPDINAIIPPINGQSGPKGTMCLETDPSGVPLVKFPALITALTAIAAAADSPVGGGASAAAAAFAATGMTNKIRAS